MVAEKYFFITILNVFNPMKKITILLKGILMWICDIIPWISGWTIAFITWIYDRLIDALHGCNFKAIKLLFTGEFKQLWKQIDGTFLVLLFWGILLAILLLSNLLQIWLEQHPQHIWSFFFWLILASAYLMKKHIKKRNIALIILWILWLAIGYVLSNLHPINIWTANSTMFISWAIAIIAMILPGISGSYILLILGQYSVLLWYITSITHWNTIWIVPIICFMIGAVIGLVLFSKLLHRIKSKYHDQMVIILIGIMLGSLNKLRPWKTVLETYMDSNWTVKPLTTQNFLPQINTNFWILIGLLLTWIIIVIGIEFGAKKLTKKIN